VKILVADDSKTNLAILSATLSKLGHDVIAVSSGQQAIKSFEQNRPDLVILDVMMEGMDGFECARHIRVNDTDDWIPIIFLSASVDDASIAKGIDAGGDDYLTKPYSEVTLAAKIKAMQRISDMRQTLFETTQKLYLLSSTDTLTGIYNRLQFDRSIKEILAAADRHQHEVALFFIDLDNFKNVNDTFGHHIGDILLVEVAQRLKSCLRANDFLARLSGDEFAVILGEIKNKNDPSYIAQKIINALSKDYQLEGHHIRISASLGIARYPDNAKTAEELILNSDVAMYHAKSTGRNNYQYYTKELSEKYRQHINLEHALKFALERNEIILNYQPIFNIHTNQLIGMETLATWEHPQFGLVSPNIFIPLAEETRLITHIGNWILKTACAEYTKWPIDKNKFRFAVNISSYQLLHPDFYGNLISLLKDYQIPPSALELELTETTMMTYTNGLFKEIIKKIHELGIGISIDDFGTGYSSLFRLRHLPINTLKIEKSFVQDAVVNSNVAIIVNCLIALGKNLEKDVIAEGIETKAQLDFLINSGCLYGQGFYLSKPMDAEKTHTYLKSISHERARS
jgi:diguanylate cyclase (GGDEF)-like protein